MKTEKFTVTGMTCAACQANVERAVKRLEGVSAVEVSLLGGRMTVTYDEAKLDAGRIAQAVRDVGYGAEPERVESGAGARDFRSQWRERQKAAEEERASMLRRLVSSVALLVPLMYIAMGGMMGLPMPGFFTGMENVLPLAFTQLLLSLVIIYINRKFFTVGFKALANRAPNMDSLVAIGSGAALLYGVAAMYMMMYGMGQGDMARVHQYAHQLYFESSAMILTLVTVGKYLEARSKSRTSSALDKLVDLAPRTALVVRDGVEVETPVEALRPGDIVSIKPGASIPADGEVIEGGGFVDQAAITGESMPVEKNVGDRVISATVNRNGAFRMRADRVGDDTTLSQIIRLVDDAGNSKAPIARLADRVSGVFVPTVIAIALVTAAVWLIAGQTFEFALSCAISVLVISCPCALGLATPVAIMVGNGVGAKHGVLFKTAVSLEEAGKTQIVALDKTGTITSGEPKVTDVLPAQGVSEAELLRTAAALEQKSEHPLARAVLEYAREQRTDIPEVENFRALPGSGLAATLDGAELSGGNLKFIGSQAEITDEMRSASEALAEQGKTPLFFCRGGVLIGIIAVADVIKADSPQAVKELQNMGIRVVMLTGDNERTARAIGRQAGVDEVIAGVLPEGKESLIRKLKQQGKVAMVGDGINDAPALTSADIGVAIGAGTDVAIDAADVVLMKSRLSDVPAAIRLSRATLTNIHENLFWAFIYNTLGIPLAAGAFIHLFGWQLNPMFGAAAMSLSSFCVVTNALRLNLFDMHSSKHDRKIKTRQHHKEEKKMEKTMKIEGMMCGHCEARVTKTLEGIEGETEAKVSHTAGTAIVTLSAPVADVVRTKAVEDQDYKVLSIG